MANFDLVFAYDAETAGEFRKQRLTHPKARKGNRVPTTADLRWAVDELDNATYDNVPRGDDDGWRVQEANEGYWIRIAGFDWDKPTSIPGDHFVIYGGTTRLAIAIVIKLAERCGQLVIWPDSGAPPIVLDGGDDPAIVDEIYTEHEGVDDWEAIFEQMYGSD